MITLAAPLALLLLPLPLVVWRFAPPYRTRDAALRFPFFDRIVAAAGAQAREGASVLARTRLQRGAAIVVWLLLVLALARPERVGAPIEEVRAARDVVLAIDISGSMDAVDFAAPDGTKKQRLAGVRDVVRQFVAARAGDRVALIVFGSKAYVQAPLTDDLATVADYLDQTAVGMAGPHTAIGDAIGLAIKTFQASAIEQRLLILLSDGTDTGSRMSPVNAAEIARGEGVTIFTVGVGDPDAAGEDKVDLATLRKIAARSGGKEFFATDANALAAIYAEIDTLAPREVKRLSYRPKTSLAHLPLALALAVGTLALALQTALARRRAPA